MSVRTTRNAMVTPSTTEMAAIEKAKTSELKTSVGMSAGMRMARARAQLARVTCPAATGEADQKLPKMSASTGMRMTKPMTTIRMVYTALMAFSVCMPRVSVVRSGCGSEPSGAEPRTRRVETYRPPAVKTGGDAGVTRCARERAGPRCSAPRRISGNGSGR